MAIEASDITLISGALSGLVTAIDLSRATMRDIRQNLVFAFLYNGIGIPIAAGVLYPAFGLRLSPVIAAASMALSSLSVAANANRLRGFTPASPVEPQLLRIGEPVVEVGDAATDAARAVLPTQREAAPLVGAKVVATTALVGSAQPGGTRSQPSPSVSGTTGQVQTEGVHEG